MKKGLSVTVFILGIVLTCLSIGTLILGACGMGAETE